tara:strand:+ start:409 stop:843 length:435 start_codon:yes stop_codon:yes gene_type:complete
MAVNKIDRQVWEVLELVRKARTKEEKIKILKQNDHWAIRDILLGTYSDRIEWILPKGKVPYRPSNPESAPTDLRRKNTEFRYFTKGGKGEKMSIMKRESMFIGLLEGIHPNDAELVVNMINKKKIEGITKNVAMEAYPDIPEWQ